MKSPAPIAIIISIAVTTSMIADAVPQNKAPAPHNVNDCYCQCSSLGFTDRYGVRQGNCRT